MEKIDFVITWVDGSDEKWLAKKREYEKLQTEKAVKGERERKAEKGEAGKKGADARYRDWGLLPYLFRGIEQYASWVNHVFLVTDHQIPEWLNRDYPKASVVYHDQFIPKEYLPTFNSHTIELNLHRIPGLSEQFVYFNDDCFLTRMCSPEASLNGINGKDNEFARIQFQNMALMNCYYSVNDCKKNLSKWLRPSYGRNLFRTLLLLPFQRLQGIYNPQLLTHWFIPHKSQNKYCSVAEPAGMIARNVKKYKMVCINDAELEEKQFLRKRKEIQRITENAFPSKSAFEKE